MIIKFEFVGKNLSNGKKYDLKENEKKEEGEYFKEKG